MKPEGSHAPTVVGDPAVLTAENGAGATTRGAERFCAFSGGAPAERRVARA